MLCSSWLATSPLFVSDRAKAGARLCRHSSAAVVLSWRWWHSITLILTCFSYLCIWPTTPAPRIFPLITTVQQRTDPPFCSLACLFIVAAVRLQTTEKIEGGYTYRTAAYWEMSNSVKRRDFKRFRRIFFFELRWRKCLPPANTV